MKILLVEDHGELARWLAKALRDASFTVEHASSGLDADALLQDQSYALVILDLTLPDLDGLDVLKRFRTRGKTTPVLILTARGTLSDRVQGLNLGADDYLAKPFELTELEARVKALIRRSQGQMAARISYGNLAFDGVARTFSCGGTDLTLTPREKAVLETLFARPGKAVSKERMFESIFVSDADANMDAIEIYIHRLRRKLEGSGMRIVTLRGIGYLLEADGGR